MTEIDFLDMKKFKETVKGNFQIKVGYFSSFLRNVKVEIQFIFTEKDIVAFELSYHNEMISIFHANVGYPTEQELLEAYDALIGFIEESPAFRLRSVTGEKIYNRGYSKNLSMALINRRKGRDQDETSCI